MATGLSRCHTSLTLTLFLPMYISFLIPHTFFHLLFPQSLSGTSSISLSLCTFVTANQFSNKSSCSNLVHRCDSQVPCSAEACITSSSKAHACTWLWVCFTFVTCWSECPSLSVWPYRLCIKFLEIYKCFSNMHFPIVRRWHACQQTTVHCWMWLKNPPWGFSFFFNCNFSIKSLTAVPFLSVRTPDCTSSLCLLPTTSWELHYFFSWEFTYCSGLKKQHREGDVLFKLRILKARG